MAAIWADNFVKNELASWEDRSGTRLVRIHSEVLEHWLFFFFLLFLVTKADGHLGEPSRIHLKGLLKPVQLFFFV